MDLISLSDAAKRYGVSAQTLRNYIRAGKLSEHRLGRYFRVNRAELEAVLSTPIRERVRSESARVMAIANQKGGSGKTTTATCLAWHLAEIGRTLAIDMDPQANLTMSFGIKPDKAQQITIYEVLMEGAPIHEAICHMEPPPANLDLVGSNLDLADFPRRATARVSGATMLRKALVPLLKEYEFIVIDSPPSLDLLTINALAAANEVIVPVEMGGYAVKATAKLVDLITEVREVNPDLPMPRFLACRVSSDNLTETMIGQLWRAYKSRLYETTISKSNKVGEAQGRMRPLPSYAPECTAAKDYKRWVETEVLHA